MIYEWHTLQELCTRGYSDLVEVG